MTAKTITAMKAEIDSLLATNSSGDISALDLRTVLKNTIDSIINVFGFAAYQDTTYTTGSPLSLLADTDTVLPNDAGTVTNTYKPVEIDTFYAPASLYFDTLTEDFVVGETVTGGSSGATATILGIRENPEVANSGILLLSAITGTFTDNEAITGSGSGSANANGSNDVGRIAGTQGETYAIHIEYKCRPTNANTTRIDTWFDIQGAVGELYNRTTSLSKGNGVEHNVTFTTRVYALNTWQGNAAIPYVNAVNTAEIYDIRFIIYRESVPVV